MNRRTLIALLITTALLGALGVTGCRQPATPDTPAERPVETTTQPETPTPTTPASDDAVGYYLVEERVTPARLPGVEEGNLQATMEALVRGIPEEAAGFGLTSSIPPATKVNSVVASGDEVTVDLSSEFGSGGGSLSMQTRVAQVVFTLTRDPRYTAVRILIDGEAVESIGGEGVMIAAPQTRETWEPFSPAVLVESPVLGDTVGNPVRVTGTANVFEAEFKLELTDGDGIIIANRNVMATSGSGTRGTFDAELDYTSAKPGIGAVIPWYSSAKDGSRVVVAEIPVRFP